ncbi:hypothetical protein [Mycobacterium heckeshornense]|uniref:hypothetical protein n=1 Tax=Mycobacterium heckeshornense TaxID=110505 RepID=UPI001944B9E6|nr:hypothetical protein [Mycobacterium heckeshornense]
MWPIGHTYRYRFVIYAALLGFPAVPFGHGARHFAAAFLLEQWQRLERDSRPLSRRQMTAMISVTPTKRVSTTSVTRSGRTGNYNGQRCGWCRCGRDRLCGDGVPIGRFKIR